MSIVAIFYLFITAKNRERLALIEKGMDPKVKDFGRMMVEDHGKANEELKGIARSKNIQLPTKLDDKHQELSDKLAKLSGK